MSEDFAELRATINKLRSVLADIALSEDLTLEVIRKKALRHYQETAPPGEESFEPEPGRGET